MGLEVMQEPRQQLLVLPVGLREAPAGLQRGVEQRQLSQKEAWLWERLLLFCSVLPAALVILLSHYLLVCLSYWQRKAFVLPPRRLLLAFFLVKPCYSTRPYMLVCVV